MLHLRLPSNPLQCWNEPLIAPFEQSDDRRETALGTIEVMAFIGLPSGQPDDVEQYCRISSVSGDGCHSSRSLSPDGPEAS